MKHPVLYRLCRWLFRAALGFYFARIERFHPEHVPATGPLLFASNHPNSITDAFVIGSSVCRKVNFVATVQLFGFPPLCWLLTQCGVIPINRLKDDPRAMRTVMNTFEACFRVLEQGEAVAIFPEGITQDDPQLKAVKTGAARMALELEHRHAGKLGLRIVPVGLTLSAKEKYRSDVLVNFGEPILVSDYLVNYDTNKHGCIQALSAEIERRIKSLMVHLPHLERARLVKAVKKLYLDRLWVANSVIHEPVSPQAGELILTQTITQAIDSTFDKHPERAAEFSRKLDRYESTLRKLRLSDDVLAVFPERTAIVRQSLGSAAVAIFLSPVAAYGWLHRLIPHQLVQWVVRKSAKQPVDKTHVSSASMLSGIVFFPVCYGLFAFIFFKFFGWPATFWYALSLPVASLVAHYYLARLRHFGASLRASSILMRAPAGARRLLGWRKELVALIESERKEFRAEQVQGTTK